MEAERVFHPNHYRPTPENIRNCIIHHQTGRGLVPHWYGNTELKADGNLYYLHNEILKRMVLPEERNQILLDLYTDPATTGSRDNLYRRVDEKYCNISRRCIDVFLKELLPYQLRFRVSRPRIQKSIVVPDTKEGLHWQMDLFYIRFPNQNDRCKYVLSVIDLFSKRLFCRPLRDKTAGEVVVALRDIIDNEAEQPPIKLQSDRGLEFRNDEMKHFLRERKINWIFSNPYAPTTQGAIERSNRTIKDKINSWILITGKRRWIDHLQSLVLNYNSSVHSTTSFAPNKLGLDALVETKESALESICAHAMAQTVEQRKDLKVNDQVRIALPREYRERNKINWSLELYRIVRVLPAVQPWERQRYVCNDERTYSENELQKITAVKRIIFPAVPRHRPPHADEKRPPTPPDEKRPPSPPRRLPVAAAAAAAEEVAEAGEAELGVNEPEPPPPPGPRRSGRRPPIVGFGDYWWGM